MWPLTSAARRCGCLTSPVSSLLRRLQPHLPESLILSFSSFTFSGRQRTPFALLSHPTSSAPPPLYAIVGLGNSGTSYTSTRHNVGRLFVSSLAAAYSLDLDQHFAHHCRIDQTVLTLPLLLTRSQRLSTSSSTSSSSSASSSVLPSPARVSRHVLLCQPETMMNLSGRAVASLTQCLPLPASHVLLVYDDLHLPLGSLRLAVRGGSGGHNGLQSVLDCGLHQVIRVRVGVGQQTVGKGKRAAAQRDDIVSLVLSDFTAAELRLLRSDVFVRLQRLVEDCIASGPEAAMRLHHGNAQQQRSGQGKLKGELPETESGSRQQQPSQPPSAPPLHTAAAAG